MRLWNIADGARLADYDAQPGVITRTAFSPDGKLLLTGNVWHDMAARLWNVETGEEVARLWNERFPECVAYAPDGTWLATGEAWGAKGPYHVRLWDPTTAEKIRSLPFDHDVRAIDIAPASDRLVVATGRVKAETFALGVYDAKSGAPLAACEGDVAGIKDAKFLPDGASVAAVDESGRLRLWDAATGRLTREFAAVEGAALEGVALDALAVSPTGEHLATGGADGAVRLWAL
jgi:WD40 repeat protein